MSALVAQVRINYESAEALAYRKLLAHDTGLPAPSAIDTTGSSSVSGPGAADGARKGAAGEMMGSGSKPPPPEWTKDKEAKSCQRCLANFSLFKRRHHCRKCGRCVCAVCAPAENSRPLPEFGHTKSVRCCLDCFNPPSAQKKAQA